MADHPEKCDEAPVSIKFAPSLRKMTALAAAHDGQDFGTYVKACVMRDLESKMAVAETYKPFLQVASLLSK